MRKIFFLLFFVATMPFVFNSCSKDSTEDETPPASTAYFKFADGSDTSPEFEAEGGSENIKFSTSHDWTASADKSWITLSRESGASSTAANFTITVSENTTTSQRTGVVTIISNGKSYKIHISQKGKKISSIFIEYTSTDGNIVSPDSTAFGATIVSNTYKNGEGIIIFDADITSIGVHAFSNCSKLSSISIPEGVTSIEDGAFFGCTSLTRVTIPNSVTEIGDVFVGCSVLTRVDITNLSAWCKIKFSYAFDYYYNLYLNGRELTDITIPSDINAIGDRAFYCCSSLTSVTIPDSITSIGGGAFCNCSSLTSVTIPNSVTSIGGCAFWGCTSLTSITIPNSVTEIGGCAFYECTSLTSVTIPNSVTEIGNKTFYNCSSLTSITIPNSVTSIGDSAFQFCTSLTSARIPDSVIKIGVWAFYDCSSLTSITIPNSVTSIGDSAFRFCTSLTSARIPDSVIKIGVRAFYGCSSLTSATIGNSVTEIGYRAFDGCISLKQVYCKATTPPTIYSTTFSNVPIGRKIYVPTASVTAYKTAGNWSDHADYIEGYDFN